MIFVDGLPFPGLASPSQTLIALLEHPSLVSASELLKAMPEKKVSMVASEFGRSLPAKHVYVFQREYATVDPALAELVGTDEATTCMGIVIRNRSTGMISIAHLDSPKVVDSGLCQMLALLVDPEDAPLDVHLIGSFEDASYEQVIDTSRKEKHKESHSLPLCTKIVEALQTKWQNFHIKTLCILGHNTKRDFTGIACPIISGFLVETSLGSIMPATFDISSRCPDEIVRRVRVTVSSKDPSWKGKLLETYNTHHDRFQIAPCTWTLDWRYFAWSLQQLTDSEILIKCSTSPLAESPDFVEIERRVFNYLVNYPDWRETFFQRQARIFERTSDGGWSRCK